MSYNPERYRSVDFIGGRILQARELQTMQDIARGVDANYVPTAFDLDSSFREGATINVTATVSGSTVTLSATDGTLPMLVFIRGQWEQLASGEAPPTVLTNPQVDVYMNWEIHQITSSDDPTLIDITTGEPAANMGELRMSVSNTDTSGTALASNQYEKNLVPVILFRYTWSGSELVPSPFTVAADKLAGNVKKQALAGATTGGLVMLTTDTASGVAVSNDDPRNSDQRVPLANSVTDVKVEAPVPTGLTNADGTTQYDLTLEAGGVSAVKIVYQAGKQLISDTISLIYQTISAIQTILAAHIGSPLGLNNTHPFPTYQQVGAAPAGHVSLALGVVGSHPPTVTASAGGFKVIRDPTRLADPSSAAYGVFEGSANIVGLMHDGDVYSQTAGEFTATPLVESGDPILGSGPLSTMAEIALVLSQHVNKYPHKNPHGLTLEDLGGEGGVTKAYVDTQDSATLASADAYANSIVPHISFNFFYNYIYSNGWAQFVEFKLAPNGGSPMYIVFGTGRITTAGTEYHNVQLPPGYMSNVTNVFLAGIPYQPGTVSEVNTSFGADNNNNLAGTFYGWQKRYDGNEGYLGPFGVEMGFWSIAWHN